MHTAPQQPVAAVRLGARFREGAFAIVHRGVSPDDDFWRVSWFDAEGPWGHTCRGTPEECIEVAVRDGYVDVQDVGYFNYVPALLAAMNFGD